ncbi:MAG TPA: hypothetical protein GXZ23_04210 [Clostridiales bacterium]|nr:hypothetical protein [Clostridiales bacterium]
MAIKASEVWIDNKCLGEEMIFAGASEYYEYTNGVKAKNPSGVKYDVLLSKHELERLSVKIPGEITPKNIEVMSRVKFTDLMVRPYSSDRGIAFTATAKDISIVESKK